MPASSQPTAALRVPGALFIGIGLAGYLLPPPPVHWTALIPVGLGLLAMAAGWLRPRPALIAGFAVCAIALFGGGSALPQMPMLLGGEAGAATASRAATALVALGGLLALSLPLLRRGSAA